MACGGGGWVQLGALLCAGLAGCSTEVSAEVTERLDAPADAVFAQLDNTDGIARWWSVVSVERGKGAVEATVHPGPVQGVGAGIALAPKGETPQTWTVLAVEPGERVVYKVESASFLFERTLSLQPDGEGTQVRWSDVGRVDGPLVALIGAEPDEGALRAALGSLGRAAGRTDARLDQAEAAAMALGKRLKGRVIEALGQGGPEGALSVCSEQAGPLGAAVAQETGAKVGRSSLRLRNPANAGPDWVSTWLGEQGERKPDDVRPQRTVREGMARVVLPIRIEAPCLLCHGEPTAISPEVLARLAERYPEDAATGYALGDLRGALWAELPLDGSS